MKLSTRSYPFLKSTWGKSFAKSIAALILAAVLPARMAQAQTLYWDAAGGTGMWDTVTSDWSTSASGGANATWTPGFAANFSDSAVGAGSYTVTLSGTETVGGASPLTFATGTATLTGGTLALGGSGAVVVNGSREGIIVSPITGSAGLTKFGSGQLDLQGANTFTGNLTVNAGVVTLDNSQAAGESGIVLTPSSSAVTLSSSSLLVTVTNNIAFSGGNNTLDINAGSGDTLVLGGTISGGNAWNADGGGFLVLSNANSFSGSFSVAQGTVVAANSQALGSASSRNVISVSSGATLAFEGGYNFPVNAAGVALNGAGVGGGAALDNFAGMNTLACGLALNANSTIGSEADDLTLNQPIAGAGYTLTKVGPAEVDLTGTGNNYGNTVVSAGTLGIFDPASAGSGLVTVDAGATLASDSSTAAPGGVYLYGMISPGVGAPCSIGTASETWYGGGSYDWTIDDATGLQGDSDGYTTLNINGTLTISATHTQPFVIHISSLDPTFYELGLAADFDNTGVYAWTIATASGGIVNFNPADFTIDDSNFVNELGDGAFIVTTNGNSLVIEFVQKPQITSGPASQTIVQCQGVTFSVTATGTGPLAYQWFDNTGAAIPGANSTSYNIPDVQFANAGSYSVTVSNLSGVVATSSATLTVTDPPPVVGTGNSIAVTLNGGSYELTPANVEALAAGSMDHCGLGAIVSTNISQTNFDCGNVGTNTVNVTLTDVSNNTASAQAVVIVRNIVPPSFSIGVSNLTVVANATNAIGLIPDLTSEVVVNFCGNYHTLAQTPAAGTPESPGSYPVTVLATDQDGNTNSSSGIITVIYTNAPVVTSCASDVTVTTIQDKDPYATGYPTVTDPDMPLTITYSDNYTNLTGCDSTGFILRTWTAEDASSNVSTCVQTITVTDTNAPYFTYVPGDIATTNTPGQCGAFVSFGGAAEDLGYIQDFEDPNWLASTNGAGSTLDWDEGASAVYRVASGSNGIVSPNGVAYAVVDSTVPQAGPNYSSSGAFTFLGGLSSWQFGDLYGYNGTSSAFGAGYRTSLEIYINLNDPAVMSATESSGYAWDLSTGASGTGSNFLNDFIFHAAAYDSSGVVIGASTQSNDSASNRGSDLRTAGYYASITSSGWYKFEWNFHSNGDNTLSVDMKVRDTNGTVLFAQTLTNGTDVSQVDGHPNYMWFTFLNLNQLPIADTVFERNEPVTSSIASGTLFPIGQTTVTNTTADACGNTTNTVFTVTVTDVEPPVLVTNGITVTLSNGSYTLSGTDIGNLLAGSFDHCALLSTNVYPTNFDCSSLGTNTVTVILTDTNNLAATGTATVFVQNLTPPSFVSGVSNQTVVANGDTANGLIPNVAAQVVVSACGTYTLGQTPAAGTSERPGPYTVTVQATDEDGNISSSSGLVTVIYTNAPVVTSCASDVTVTTIQDKDPYATGYPTVTDPDIPLTITYSDNYTNLTGCDSTGFILRTWTAEDASSNVSTCVQTITVTDTNAPYFTYVPGDIATTNTPGQCGAFVSFGGAAEDLGYIQDFEDPNWLASINGAGSTLDWDEGASAVYRVASGSNGIVSPNGVAYAVVDSTVPQAGPNYSSSGAFTFLGGLSSWQFGDLYGYNGISSAFGAGYRTSLEIYINLNDPAVMSATESSGYAWDLSTGASGTGSNFLNDFIFHAAAYDSSGVVIGASTQSNDSASNRGSDLRTAGYYASITSSGWYKFEWNFHSNGDNTLSVDMKVRDTNGVVLFAQTLTNGTDVSQVDGHPNYMWFTFLNLNQLPIADTVFERNEPVTSSIASGTLFPIGQTTVTNTAADTCGNTTNTTFTVTVTDTEAPTLVLANPVTVTLVGGSYNLSPTDVNNLVAGSSDPCGITNVTVTPNSFDCTNVGPNSVTVVVTDANGNSTTGTGTIIVQDLTPPTFVANPLTVALINGGYSLSPADVNNLEAGSSDPCGITNVTVTPNSFGCGNVGPNTVTVVLTDSHGNSTTNTATITVQDTTPPAIVTHTIPVTLGADGTYNLTGADEAAMVAGSSDSCGIESTNFSVTSFTYCQAGSSVPVTVTMSDIHGVSSNTTVSVMVNAPATAPQTVYVDASYSNECNVMFPNTDGSGSYYYGYNAFSTIQAGLNAVAAGGTVTVAPGTYNESPIINNSVTLTSIGGTNATATVIDLPINAVSYSWASALEINASSVNVEGFRIIGYDGPATDAAPTYGLSSIDILINALNPHPPAVTNIDIGNNVLEVGADNLTFDTSTSTGYGVETSYSPLVGTGTNTGPLDDNLNVHNNVFEPVDAPPAYDSIGTAFFINPAGNFMFISNTITGGLATSVAETTNSLIADNIVIGNGTTDGSGGFGTWGYPDPTVYGHTVFANNVITNTQDAITLWDSEDVVIENNMLDGNGTGVSIQDTGSVTPPADAGTDEIISNSIAGELVAGVDNEAAIGAPNANNNWWGNLSGPSSAQNPYGTGSSVTGNVTVDSWLQSGTNANTGIGFTPTGGENYPPVQLIFTTEPAGADLGSLLSTEPVVSVEDVNGDVTPWVNTTISIAISNNPALGVLVGTTNESTVNGVATFTDLYVTKDGGSGYTLIATAPDLTPAVSVSFDITNPAPAITSISPFYTLASVNVNGLTLTVNGSNFVANSTIDWNGVPVTTTNVSSTQMTATLPAYDVATAGTALVTVVSPAPGGGTSAGFTFYIEPARPAVVYVDTNYSNLPANTWVNWPYTGAGTNIIGYDAFATIQAGVNAVAPGGTVNVAAGTYAEEVTISQPLALLGPNATNNPSTSARVAEAVIEPNFNNPEMINWANPPTYYNLDAVQVTIASSGVTIKGFTVDGYNPSLSGGYVSGSDVFNFGAGIGDFNGDSQLRIENNIIENDTYAGVDLESDANGNLPNTNSCVKYNLLRNMDYNAEGYGVGISLDNNYYAEVSGNVLTNVAIGISPQNYSQSNPGSESGQMIANNSISASLLGIWVNLVYESASTFEIVDNTSTFMPTNGSPLFTQTINAPTEWDGYEITSIQSAVGVVASNDIAIGPSENVGYNAVGYNVWNTPTTGPVVIVGGSVSNVTYGVWVNDYDGYQSPGGSANATVNNLTVNGATAAGIYVQDDPRASTNGVLVTATVTGNSIITGSGSGVLVQGTNAAASVINGPSINGNSVGVAVDTGKALIQGNDLTGNSVAGISATNNAIVDAGDCSGNNLTGLGTGSGQNGSSQGLNNLSGYGFDGAAPWAIQSFNTVSGTVLAEDDNFGATNQGQNIASDISDPNGTVEYSQGTVLIAGPTNVTVICASEVPAGATNLAQFIGQGGYLSDNNSTFNFGDSDSTNFVDGTNVITIIRTYTVNNSCAPQSVVQTITLDETPPIANVPANIVQANDPGACGATVSFTVPPAIDNCGIANESVMPSSPAFFPIGVTPVVVVATDDNGFSTTNSFTVTVNDTEPPVITNAVNIVTVVDPGQTYATVNFSIGATDNCVVASISANWMANTQSALGGVVTVTGWQFPIGTNTVTVTATDVHSNITTASFTVAVIGLPQITIQPHSRTNNLGSGSGFMVVASSPASLTYQWFKDGSPLSNTTNILGTTQAELLFNSVSDSDAGTYDVQVSNFAGTVTSTDVTLTVIDPPTVTSIVPPIQTNNASTTAQFTVSATGTLPFTYQWAKVTATSTNRLSDGGNIFGSTSNVLTISNLLAAEQGEYMVTVSNSAGTDTTNALLFVNDPAILVQPSNLTNSLGGSVTFSVTAAGTAPFSYQWQQEGVNLPGATGSTLILHNINDSSAGDYAVIVSNSVGEVTSSNATLTVTHPPVITSQPANATVNLGQTATFSVAVNGDTPFTYQWYQNGLPLNNGGNVSGTTTRELILTDVTTADGGSYYVAITNDVGETISSNATLTVIVPPAITNQPVAVTTNAGSSVTFTVGASGTAPAYQWYQVTAMATNKLTDSTNITGSTSNVLTITDVLGADDGYYMAVASNHAGTVASSNALLVVIDPIITNEPSAVTTNLGSPASFTVGAYGTSPQYQWYQNGNAVAGANAATYSIATVADTNAGNYTVVVSNIFGVVTSTPAASLTVIDPPVITRQPQNVTANAGATAVFAVSYTGTSPTFQWYFGNQPLNNSATVSGANSPTLTLTDVQDANMGNYSVVLNNSITSVASSNAVLTVIDPPVISSLQPPIQTNNATTTAQFTVNVTGTAPFTYQWTKVAPTLTNVLSDGGNISGSTSNVLTIANVLAADQAEYRVTVSNPAGTVTNNGTLVVIDPAIFVQPVGQTNFTGSTVAFSVTAAGTAPLSYQWFQNGSPLFGANSNVLTLRNIADSDAGTYTVVITNSVGSVTSAPAALLTFSPLITTQPQSLRVLVGQSASFSVDVNGELPFSYQWQFNGTNIVGATSRIFTIPSAALSNAGSYQVIVENPVGIEISQPAMLIVQTTPSATLNASLNQSGTIITVTSISGYVYTLEGTTNFMVWFPIETNTAPFTFTNNSGYPYEFYRALYQQ